MDLSELVKKVAEMPDDKFERWMKRNGYTGMAAVRLNQKRREAIKRIQHKE